ncbi:MAG: cation transporter [Actinobacteria bacterium]|nr:cation transporter [Actinomycetota bacterium]
MGHDHGHSFASAGMASRKPLVITFCLGLSVLVVQFVGALLSGSLALLADTVHVFADVFGVGLALSAITLAARPTKLRRTFGLYRLEIFATVVNGVLLLSLSVFILVEAYDRWLNPATIDAPIMLAAAVYGLVANGVGVWLLRRGASRSLAVKGAYLEVLSDALGSIGVVIAAVVLLTTGWARIDVLVSIAIALFMIPRTLFLLRDAFNILMESAPTGLDLDDVRRHMCEVPGVVSVHDLHAWTITSGMPSLSAHVTVAPTPFEQGKGAEILAKLNVCLAECFEIGHTTFQLETAEQTAAEADIHP